MTGERTTALAWRGVVEGFYGRPWTFDERVTFFGFAREAGFTSYIYAPKFDPFHRDSWRDPYPEEELSSIAELNSRAAENGVTFVYAISPALSMRFADDDDHAALAAKCRQLLDAGIRSFALLFDDVPTELPHAADRERFGADARGTGRAHGNAARRFRDGFLLPNGIDEPLLVCPTDYAGTAGSPYRDGLAEDLPVDARVLWTGADIVVGEITRDDVDRAAESYGRDLVLWDNFPVNDFDRSRVFLGPLTGRLGDVAGSRLVGIAANPMVEAAPSRFALATVAEWAADPAAYDPQAAAERAYRLVTGGADGLRALVAASSSWPPSAPPSAELAALLARALPDGPQGAGDAGDQGDHRGALDALDAFDALAEWMRALADTTAAGAPADLAETLRPWIDAARAAGEAGVLACRALSADPGSAEPGLGEELLAARSRSEAEYANVVRGPLTALLDAASAHLGLVQTPGATGGAGGASATGRIQLLSGPNPLPGDRELAEALGAAGHAVTIAPTAPADDDGAGLVIVTRGADEEQAVAAGRLAVPLIAWGHLVALGLATESAVPLSLDTIDIVEPAHPAAAGLTGRVHVYRGPSKLTWGEPGPDAMVVARETESAHPVIAVYPAGSRLADGGTAAAARATVFLSTDGFAPWLLTEEARSIVLHLVTAVAADVRG